VDEDTYLTVEEAAILLKMSRPTVYRLAGRGELPATKLGKSWRISKQGLAVMFRRPRLSAEAQKALVQVLPLKGNGHAGT
jgi:excisionase family DNA binding protein